MPDNIGGDKLKEWVRSRSNYFKHMFLNQVIELRDEFAKLHIQERQLNDFIFEKEQHLLNKTEFLILPQTIERVAESLRKLADELG